MNTVKRNIITISLAGLAVGAVLGAGTMKAAPDTKAANPSTNQLSSPLLPNSALNAGQWDPFQEIQQMQAQMDHMLNQMSTEFHNEPQFSGLPENSGYSLSLNVQDQKDKYVVHAYLPDTRASDVKVKLNNDQTLQVSVTGGEAKTSNQKNITSNVSEWRQFEQSIQLPTPVKASQMKVVRHEHELVITLPKA